MRIALKVAIDEKVHDLVATNVDQIAWERHCRSNRIPMDPRDAGAVEWTTWLGWSAAKRQGIVADDMSFDQFLNSGAEVDAVQGGDEEPRPTPAAPGAS